MFDFRVARPIYCKRPITSPDGTPS